MISTFLFAIIWRLSCGIRLICTFTVTPDEYAYVGSVYQCDASVLSDNKSKEVIAVVYGVHQTNRTNRHVQGLIISSQGLEYLFSNIAQYFPNIKVLDLTSNSISYVSNQLLNPLQNLVCLCLHRNRITSLDSNLFSGLDSLRLINFQSNNIKHVGHDFMLPDTGNIYFDSNPCIDMNAFNSDQVATLRFSLLVKCPPTISQIEDTLKSRNNWPTIVDRTDVTEQSHAEMDGKVNSLTNTVTVLENRNLQLTNKVTELQQKNLQLTNEMTDLQQNNQALTNRNSELDTRAGDLEGRVAVLESIFERKLNLRIGENTPTGA